MQRLAAGKIDFSSLGAQISNQHRCHSKNKSKHGLLYFVICALCSVKLSHNFPRQRYNNQNEAEL